LKGIFRINNSKKKQGKLRLLQSALPEIGDLYGKSPTLLTDHQLLLLIEECCEQKRDSQKKLYAAFYEYAIIICLRYANTEEDAVDILNDAFLKIFREVKRFELSHDNAMAAFKGWIKKIFIYTAIDHYRKHNKHQHHAEIQDDVMMISAEDETQLEKLSYKEIMQCVQQLSPAYRTVFSLYVIDGFTHEEISRQLGIATGTSKSNLAKARLHLQKMLLDKQNFEKNEPRAV